METIRVGVIGARRRKQGIGEFVARDLARAGADVTAIVGTQADTVGTARENLAQRYGLHVRGYLSVEAMLAAERLDAVAVCSPQEVHRRHLERAVEHKLHALCEKPLVWEEGRGAADDAKGLAGAFAANRRVLMVNEPWPFTLSAFDRCWPGVRAPGRAPQSLAMLMCPGDLGDAMIPNALPHVLSLLLALAPTGGKTAEIHVNRPDEEIREVRFVYNHRAGRTAVAARFFRREHQPRPAGYAIDGCGVRRVIHLPEYRMSFQSARFEDAEEFWQFAESADGGREQTPMEDPLPLLIEEFLRRVKSAGTGRRQSLDVAEGSRLLAEIYYGAEHGRRS